jgi:hypothetical protein
VFTHLRPTLGIRSSPGQLHDGFERIHRTTGNQSTLLQIPSDVHVTTKTAVATNQSMNTCLVTENDPDTVEAESADGRVSCWRHAR